MSDTKDARTQIFHTRYKNYTDRRIYSMAEKYKCPLKHLSDTFGDKYRLPIICILSDSIILIKSFSIKGIGGIITWLKNINAR